MQPYAEERPALSEGQKGGYFLNTADLILHFADKYIAEREKNFMLQQQLEQYQQMQNEKKTKTNE